MLLLLVMVLAVFLVPRLLPRRVETDVVSGTLLVTGVSPRPDASGEQYVTIAGVISGPTVDEHSVYERMVVDVSKWPSIGELIPVVYSQRNPDKWRIARSEDG